MDGYSTVGQIAQRASELGQSAVALTDHGEVNQHYAFGKACKEAGIKPLFGMEGYWTHSVQGTKDLANGGYPKDLSHICFIAQNQKGLSNLWEMSSIAYTDDYRYHRPLATPDLMLDHADGLYASDGCLMTRFSDYIQHGDMDRARMELGTLAHIFGERFYMELHTWQFMDARDDDAIDFSGEIISTKQANAKMTMLNQAKVELANQMGIPLVVVNDAHHAYPEHWEFKELVWKFKPGKNADKNAEVMLQKADHMMGDEELVEWMALHGISRQITEEAIRNSGDIADACDEIVIKPMLSMPTFSHDVDEDFRLFLMEVEKGFKRLVEDAGLPREVYWKRMEEEVRLIADKGFAGYFLITADYVMAAKTGTWNQYVHGGHKEPMLVGPGRGSAGGSLVAYLMGITTLDPIKYGLLFSRFLSPGRKGFPDIDIDFPRSKRKDMKRYVQKRWGEDHVCSICTIGRNKAKGTLKDLGRAMDIPWEDREAMTKLIEQVVTITDEAEAEESEDGEADMTWDEIVMEKGGELAPYARKHPQFFDRMAALIGRARGSGVHAAAVLIGDKSLTGLLPMRTKNNTVTTQFDMYDVEELGGLKSDFLALRHLDVLDFVAKKVFEREGRVINWDDFGDEEYSDPDIWPQIDKGRTAGLFQIGGTASSTQSAMDYQPRSERDISALIAIVRPGVRDAGLHDKYILRRHGKEKVSYDHPMMEKITAETYGIMIYQEQLMQAARDLAGFTPDEASDLQKALGKKYMDKILAMKQKFIDGCLANPEYALGCGDPVNQTMDEAKELRIANIIWRSIEASGRYAFNKSHSQGYGLITARETWAKHYYPAIFLAGCMQYDPTKVNRYIRDARRADIPILPPDVNLSGGPFDIYGDEIRYGLENVKGVGPVAVADILKHKPFTSLEHFLDVCNGRGGAHKTVVTNLIRIGAFDSLAQPGESRSDIFRRFAATRTKADAKKMLEAMPGMDSEEDVYKTEIELLGNHVTVDPMSPYIQVLDAVAIRDPGEITRRRKGEKFIIGGALTKVKVIKVKKQGRNFGREMAFLGITWCEEDFDVTVFPDLWDRTKLLLTENAPVACYVERDDRGCHMTQLERLDLLSSYDPENASA